jgi:hypothetical protein
MRNKIIGILICVLLITTILHITAIAGDENDPEIKDHIRDVRLFGYLPFLLQSYFRHADIVSIWFNEDSNNPDYLYISLKLRNLRTNTDSLEAIYLVQWTHNDKMWEAVVKIHPTGVYESPHICRFYAHDDYSDYYNVGCTFDVDYNIITWEIPKDKIGNPQIGDDLTDVLGFTDLRNTEESGKNRADLFKDTTNNAWLTKNYRIQY